jgi:hypothetical protein
MKEKTLKLTLYDEDIIEMERLKSLHNLTDDALFSYLLRLDALADMDSLTSTERRHQVERARQASAERALAGKESPKTRKKRAPG